MRWASRRYKRTRRRRQKHLDKIEHDRVPHLWFAWHPVETDQGWVWLEKVYRHRRWMESTLRWENGAGMFGGPGTVGSPGGFGLWHYGVNDE